MSPALAGLALIPTTLPMVFVAPLAGRWYDRSGGRPPLAAGFAVLLASRSLLSWPGAWHSNRLPAFVCAGPAAGAGTGLALILTSPNEPVSIDTVPGK